MDATESSFATLFTHGLPFLRQTLLVRQQKRAPFEPFSPSGTDRPVLRLIVSMFNNNKSREITAFLKLSLTVKRVLNNHEITRKYV